MTLRNGVLILQDGIASDADAVIQARREDLNPIFRGELTWQAAEFETRGDTALAKRFWTYFDNQIFADHISVR